MTDSEYEDVHVSRKLEQKAKEQVKNIFTNGTEQERQQIVFEISRTAWTLILTSSFTYRVKGTQYSFLSQELASLQSEFPVSVLPPNPVTSISCVYLTVPVMS